MYSSSHRPGLGILALCLLGARPAFADEALYRKVAPSTALIYKNEGPLGGGSGTGFLVDAQERLLITARHVVENRIGGGVVPAVVVIFAQTEGGDVITDAEYYRKNWQTLALRGKVVYDSVRRDMAVIQVEKLPSGVRPLELAARPARPGQSVHIIGNASEHFGGVFSYCRGYVRNVFRYEDLGARVVTTQVPTNKGDSGGPTVNNLGEVVGFAAMSTYGGSLPKNSPFHDLQVTGLSICVTEIRDGLKEMRTQMLAGSGQRAGPAAPQTVVFQAQARSGTHFVTLEKDVLYRILVKAKGFVPDVHIGGFLVNPMPAAFAASNEWQQLFTPKETKEYRIDVGHLPGRPVGKGSFPYTLTVDQVAFAPESTFKEPQLKLNEDVQKLQAGKAYRIVVRAKGFEPDVEILHGSKVVAKMFNNGYRMNPGGVQGLFEAIGLGVAEFETSLTYLAAQTGDYRILVAVSPWSPRVSDPLAYTVQIGEQKLHFSANGQLTAKEPLYPRAGPFKAHAVRLEGGKDYQIDLSTTAFDSHLVLEDSTGKVVAQGHDVEGYNSRLFYRSTQTNTYRIVATSHQVDATGPYLLSVMDNPTPQTQLPGLQKKSMKGSK